MWLARPHSCRRTIIDQSHSFIYTYILISESDRKASSSLLYKNKIKTGRKHLQHTAEIYPRGDPCAISKGLRMVRCQSALACSSGMALSGPPIHPVFPRRRASTHKCGRWVNNFTFQCLCVCMYKMSVCAFPPSLTVIFSSLSLSPLSLPLWVFASARKSAVDQSGLTGER